MRKNRTNPVFALAAIAALTLSGCFLWEPDCYDDCEEPTCIDDSECDHLGDECDVSYCGSSSCEVEDVASGTPCSIGVCNAGTCVECASSAQCWGAPCHEGQCVPLACVNGLLDDAESDVDCGGPCPPCGFGDACSQRSDCPVGGRCGEDAVCVAQLLPGSLALGSQHSCVTHRLGYDLCWGLGTSGQLGNGSGLGVERWTSPDRIYEIESIRQLSAAGAHTCAITLYGVECVGRANRSGLRFRDDAAALVAGVGHDCAILVDGSMHCWGEDAQGQLGNGPVDWSGRGVQMVVRGHLWRAASAGREHVCGLTTEDEVYCWGANQWGQLGDGTTEPRGTPTLVEGLSGTPVGVAAGADQSCAFFAEGGAECWGRNQRGQLGDGTLAHRSAPVAVGGLVGRLDAMALGDTHTCALTVDRRVLCWGANDVGQLGDETTADRAAPTEIALEPSLQDPIVALAAGDAHTCALTHEELVYCWGQNDQGQLGDGTTVPRATPAPTL